MSASTTRSTSATSSSSSINPIPAPAQQPSVSTRRAAAAAKVQTRGMLREQQQRDEQRKQQQQPHQRRQPSAALLEAKRKAKEQQQQQQQPQAQGAKDIYQRAMDAAQRMLRGATGLVYDDRMAEHRCLWDPEFPECPERFTRVIERCSALQLVSRCSRIASRPATTTEVLLSHTQAHYDLLASTAAHPDEEHLEELSSRYDAIYLHPTTFDLSLLAVGSTIELLDNIFAGRVQNGMAVIRPPGHHAMKAEFNGYCFFNNVAVAAQRALDRGQAKRILIVDWDVHHGQATQRAFYDDDRVLYFSVHRYENGMFWPNLRESDFDCIGEGKGEGYNFNVPLNKVGMQNADYLAIWQQLLMPAAIEFQPDLVIVSAGYDAALGCVEFNPELVIVSAGFDSAMGDEKGEMEITPACYAHLLAPLMTLASGRVAVILEGGYCLQSLAEGASLTLRTLLGDPCPPLVDAPAEVSDSMRTTILNCIHAHRPFWRSLQVQRTYGLEEVNNVTPDPASDRHRVVQRYEWSEPQPDRYPTRAWYPTQTGEVKAELARRLTALEERTDLRVAEGGVGFVYDEVMLEHRNLFEDHPERPERLTAIERRLHDCGLLPMRLQRIVARPATTDELCTAHSRSHVNRIRRTSSTTTASTTSSTSSSSSSPERDESAEASATAAAAALRQAADTFNSVYFHPSTFASATVAAGGVLAALDAVVRGRVRSAICAVRPPGHHAEAEEPHGFCIFNNVAVAAQVALRDYPTTVRRVLIVDWDVHHGNGTQHMFAADPRVLYVSVHRYDNGAFFPKREDADAGHCGSGAGRGFNVNVPWNRKGMGDAEYAAIFQRIIMPVAYEFGPDLVLVSADFDAAAGDPLGGCRVTPEAFGHFTAWLQALAGGKVVLVLEGGYNVNSVAWSMAMCAKALLGDPLPPLQVAGLRKGAAGSGGGAGAGAGGETLVQASALETLQRVWEVQAEHWRSLHGWNVRLPSGSVVASPELEQMAAAFGGMQLADRAAKREEAEVGAAGGSSTGAGGAAGAAGGGSAEKGQTATLQEFLAANREALQNEEMFAVVPVRDCPHLWQLPDNDGGLTAIDTRRPCSECPSATENWLCLHCHRTFCSRYQQAHMLAHNSANAQHSLALSFADLSVWCYGCEAYVDHPRLYNCRNLAHQDKFGEELPWSYAEAEGWVEFTLG